MHFGDEKRVGDTTPLRRGVLRASAARLVAFAALVILGTLAYHFQSGSVAAFKLRSFQSCNICGPHNDLCDKWGSRVLRRSRVYEGSGSQMLPFFEKVFSGQPIVIDVMGGSMSACMDSTPQECYVNLLEEHLRVELGVNVTVVNRAVPASGSSYFAACESSTTADLVLMEFGVNDDRAEKMNEDLDALLRSILTQEKPPAVLFFNMFSPLQPFANGSPSIDTLAQYYDLPVISHRNVVFHQRHLQTKPEQVRKWFALGENNGVYTWKGGHHPSKLGHELSVDLLISWFREQLCKAPYEKFILDSAGRMDLYLPRTIPLWGPYQRFGAPPLEAQSLQACYSAEPGPLHFPISKIPSESAGWTVGHWKTKNFLVAHNPGDKVVFDLEVNHGEVTVMYWMGFGIGLGRAVVWLDGEEDTKHQIWGDYSGSTALGNRPTFVPLLSSKQRALDLPLVLHHQETRNRYQPTTREAEADGHDY